MTTPRTCTDCGQRLTRGWTGGKNTDENTRCLICLTARIMTSFRMPMRKAAQKRAI